MWRFVKATNWKHLKNNFYFKDYTVSENKSQFIRLQRSGKQGVLDPHCVLAKGKCVVTACCDGSTFITVHKLWEVRRHESTPCIRGKWVVAIGYCPLCWLHGSGRRIIYCANRTHCRGISAQIQPSLSTRQWLKINAQIHCLQKWNYFWAGWSAADPGVTPRPFISPLTPLS